MKTAIVYYSKHHLNTKKVVDYICNGKDITLINALEDYNGNLAEYDLIGFASGIYYSKFHKSVLKFAKDKLPENKDVFFIYTYGAKKDGYTNAIKSVTKEKNANVLGEFGCYGFNTFGPFKLIGGIAKGRPNNKELADAKKFFESVESLK